MQASTLLLFAHVSFYGFALPLICLAGFLGTVASALVQTRLYLFAPEPLRSQTMALYVVALVGFNAIGGMIGGSLAQASSCSEAVTWLAGILGVGILLLKPALSLGKALGRAGSRER